ncbi:MAG: thioredoxin domain-containing protein [Candidatus Woesearchaeota archaeon]|jgi:protein-disulfide isomerase
MICFIALIIFGILGIFSASHRKIAKEAFDCVFRKITLRKCHTGLDVRLKSNITSKFLEKTPRLGKMIYTHFEILSFMFTILMIGSLVWSGISVYNYVEYGNCNGPSVKDQQGLCLFDPTKENAQITICEDTGLTVANPTLEPTVDKVNTSLFPHYVGKEVKDTLVYVGCYACPNTKKVNPIINQLVTENKDTLNFVFVHLPLHQEYTYVSKIENCLFETSPTAYWDFHNALMQMPIDQIKIKENVVETLTQIKGVNSNDIFSCSESEPAEILFQAQLKEINKMNVEGTPTIFINHQVFIGPKPLRVYERQLSTSTDWFGLGLIGVGALILIIILYFIIFKREKRTSKEEKAPPEKEKEISSKEEEEDNRA